MGIMGLWLWLVELVDNAKARRNAGLAAGEVVRAGCRRLQFMMTQTGRELRRGALMGRLSNYNPDHPFPFTIP